MTIRKYWFDMILKEIKKEEYRENKPYWTDRLYYKDGNPQYYDAIQLTNGYDADSPSILMDYLGVNLGKPRPEWCPDQDRGRTLYRIYLGDFIAFHNVPENQKPFRFRETGN